MNNSNVVRIDENNRTEKYWTATVLPALLAINNFKGIEIFLKSISQNCNLVFINADKNNQTYEIKKILPENISYDNIQISTELWYARDFLENEKYSAVPDLIIIIENKFMIVVEAKFFMQVKQSAIEKQIDNQKTTIGYIRNNYSELLVHHCFIYGGFEKFENLKNVNSIITWGKILEEFKKELGKNSNKNYFINVLERGIENYTKEIEDKNKEAKDKYYVDLFDFIALIQCLKTKRENTYIGFSVGEDSGENTFRQLIEAIKEEMRILRDINIEKFKKRPEFLKKEKYNNQSAIEYLLKHSGYDYKVDYLDGGSGDDKSKKPNWINGNQFYYLLKELIK